jgi:hypothetical protein
MPKIHRSKDELETTCRYDLGEKVLWLATTIPAVAARWRRAGYPNVTVLGTVGGRAVSWELKLAWDGSRRTWTRAVAASLPRTARSGRGSAAQSAVSAPKSGGLGSDQGSTLAEGEKRRFGAPRR